MLHETLRAALRQHGSRKRAAGGVEYDIERPIESRPGVSMWTGRAHDYLLPPSDWRAKRDEWIVGLIDPLEKRDTFPKRDGGAARFHHRPGLDADAAPNRCPAASHREVDTDALRWRHLPSTRHTRK